MASFLMILPRSMHGSHVMSSKEASRQLLISRRGSSTEQMQFFLRDIAPTGAIVRSC